MNTPPPPITSPGGLIQLTWRCLRFEQLTHHTTTLRHELRNEIERILQESVKFKMHIQKGLEDYEGFVVEEVEAELGNEDDEDGNDEGDDAGGLLLGRA